MRCIKATVAGVERSDTSNEVDLILRLPEGVSIQSGDIVRRLGQKCYQCRVAVK